MPKDIQAFNKIDQSTRSFNKAELRQAIEQRQQTTSELIGVMVSNVRHIGLNANFLDTPTSIDTFDQRNLLLMRLITGITRSAMSEYSIPTPQLTKLGAFIVERAVLLQDIDDGSLPVIDTNHLWQIIS